MRSNVFILGLAPLPGHSDPTTWSLPVNMYELGPELTHCGTPGNNSTFMRKRAPSITFTAQFLAQYSTLHVLFVRCLVPSSIPRRVKFFLLILFKFKETLTTCTTWYNRTVSIPLIPYKGRHKKKKSSNCMSVIDRIPQIACRSLTEFPKLHVGH